MIFLLMLLMCTSAEFSSIGQTCDAKSTFLINNFVSSPWPATANIQLNLSMSGVFKSEEYISDILIKTSFKKGAWVNRYVDVNEKYNYGQIYTFTFTTTTGTLSGEYRTQVMLERKEGSAISCWEFYYTI